MDHLLFLWQARRNFYQLSSPNNLPLFYKTLTEILTAICSIGDYLINLERARIKLLKLADNLEQEVLVNSLINETLAAMPDTNCNYPTFITNNFFNLSPTALIANALSIF